MGFNFQSRIQRINAVANWTAYLNDVQGTLVQYWHVLLLLSMLNKRAWLSFVFLSINYKQSILESDHRCFTISSLPVLKSRAQCVSVTWRRWLIARERPGVPLHTSLSRRRWVNYFSAEEFLFLAWQQSLAGHQKTPK